MAEEQPLGTLIPNRGSLNTYTAKCALCEWHWAGDRKKAEETLRGHARLSHPPTIQVYRDREVPDA